MPPLPEKTAAWCPISLIDCGGWAVRSGKVLDSYQGMLPARTWAPGFNP